MSDTCTAIVTHRGLDPSRIDFPWYESTYESFQNHRNRGYGIEFDVQVSADNEIIVFHDRCLKELSEGENPSELRSLTLRDIQQYRSKRGRIASLEEVLQLLDGCSEMNALHVKYFMQEKGCLDRLISTLKSHVRTLEHILLFDLTEQAAHEVRRHLPIAHIAPSVAHPFDIQRYGSSVGGTLKELQKVIGLKDLFDWVWLDEWDRTDSVGGTKALYTQEVFATLRSHGFKVALVSPELHATSPGLLGGESHQDAVSIEKLKERQQSIVELRPDLICTDYPDMLKEIINQVQL